MRVKSGVGEHGGGPQPVGLRYQEIDVMAGAHGGVVVEAQPVGGNTSPTPETDMKPDTRLSIPPQVMSRQVGEETVLLDLESGIYFGLDGVGKRIWESFAEGRSLGEAAAVIITEYEVEEERAAADVIEFATDLVARGLLEAP